jgi:hypothetical protein
MKNSIIIIISGVLILFIFAGGYTVVNKSSTSSEYTNPQQDFNYLVSGHWTKREGGVNHHNGVVNAWILDYYLNFNSNGTYGFSYDNRPNKISGNYYLNSDTLRLVTDKFISRYQFSRDGDLLKLKFINLEQMNERYFPARLEGEWKLKY